MFTTLDLILLVSDYLGFLLEPIYEKFAKRLNLKPKNNMSQLYSIEAPWLLRDHKIENSLNGLELEMEAFHEMQKRRDEWNDSTNGRAPMVELVKQAIESKWPWACLHLAPTDPVGRQLNWTDYDLCLMDDWDFPSLAPSFDCLTIDGDAQEVGPNSEGTKGGIWAAFKRVGGTENVENYGCSMRVIHSSSLDRKIFLELKAHHLGSSGKLDKVNAPPAYEQQQQQQQQDSCGEKPIICIKWLTLDEFLREEERAKLVFYYTQIHPELTVLYGVVSSLLDSAQLIEPAGGGCTGGRPLQVDKWPSMVNCGKSSGNKPSGGKQQQQQQPEEQLLSRYALVLMLVAYLNSERALKLRKGNGKNLLAQHLIGFLSAYSLSSSSSSSTSAENECIYIGPKFNGDGSLELNRQSGSKLNHQLISGAGQQSMLIVLDPIAKVDCNGSGPSKLSKRIARELIASRLSSATQPQSSEGLTNLTKNLASVGAILELFNELRQHLNKSFGSTASDHQETTTTATHNTICPNRSPLAVLFTLCQPSAHKEPFTPSWGLPSDVTASAIETGGASGNRHSNGPSPTSGSPLSSLPGYRRRRRRNPLGLNLSSRKILTNLLYLALFLLLRNHLLNYLMRLRANLQEQARDDWVHLKHALFEQTSLAQQRDDDYYGNLNGRRVIDDESTGFENGDNLLHGALDLEKMFGSLMAEATNPESGEPGSDASSLRELPDYDGFSEDEDDDLDGEGDASEELFGNLFASMLTGRSRGGPGAGKPPQLDLAKLMGGLGAGAGAGNSSVFSEMFGGKNPPDINMAQLEAMLQNLMNSPATEEADLDPSTILEDKSGGKQPEGSTATQTEAVGEELDRKENEASIDPERAAAAAEATEDNNKAQRFTDEL